MTEYWVSTKKFFCDACQIWVPESIRNTHLQSEVHLLKKRISKSRKERDQRIEQKRKANVAAQIYEIEKKALKSLSGESKKEGITIKGKDGGIGPAFPPSYYKQKEKEEEKVPVVEKTKEFEENYRFYYEKFLLEAQKKKREDELNKINIEVQAQLDVEKHFQEMMKKGIFPQFPQNFQPQQKQQTTEEEVAKKKRKEQLDNLDLSKQYYYNPDFFYSEKSTEFFDQKEKEKENVIMQQEIQKKINKKKEKKQKKKMKKKMKKIEKMKYYRKYEKSYMDPKVDQSTGFGQWEDVKQVENNNEKEDEDDNDSKSQDEDSILKKRKLDEKEEPPKKRIKKETDSPIKIISNVQNLVVEKTPKKNNFNNVFVEKENAPKKNIFNNVFE